MGASWETRSDDYSLEGCVRRVAARGETAGEAKFTVRDLPAVVVTRMRLIHYSVQVKTRVEAGFIDRPPSMHMIEEGMTECGLRVLEREDLVRASKGNYRDELSHGSPLRALRDLSYSFPRQGVVDSGVVRLCGALSHGLGGQITDYAWALHLTKATLLSACWVAALSRSEEWATEHTEVFSRSFTAFVKWLEVMHTAGV